MSDAEEEAVGGSQEDAEGAPVSGAEALIEGEAEGSDGSEEGGSDADSSEEEEGDDEFEEDGFVVRSDEEEEEGGGSDGGGVKRKRKKKRKPVRNLTLDEDDYDLLEENQVKVTRPTGHKRLKRVQAGPREEQDAEQMRKELFGNDELEDELEDLDDDDPRLRGAARRGTDTPGGGRPGAPRRPPSGPGARPGRDGDSRGGGGAAARGGGAGQGGRGSPGGEGGRRGSGGGGRERGGGGMGDELGGDDEEDEMGDFIVDEGPAGVERARRRRAALAGAIPGINADALNEAADIFGDVSELLDTYMAHKGGQGAGGEADELEVVEDEVPPDEDEDEEAALQREAAREEKRRAALMRKAMRLLDAETLAEQHLLPEDQRIRDRDWPERFQLLGVEQRAEGLERLDLDACADWVYTTIFTAREVEGRCMDSVRKVLEEGVLEVDASHPPPRPEGWLQGDLLLDKDDLGRNPSEPVPLGWRRAVRGPRSSEYAQSQWRTDEAAQSGLRAAIRAVLGAMYERGEEVALLALYRRELVGELGALRMEDVPQVTSEAEVMQRRQTFAGHPRAEAYPIGTVQPHQRRIRRFDALWAVLRMSLRYRRIARRHALLQRRVDSAVEVLLSSGGPEAPLAATDAAELQAALPLLQDSWSEVTLNDIEAKLKLVQDVYGSEALGTGSQADPQGGTQGARPNRPGPSAGGTGALGGAAYRALRGMGLGELAGQVLLAPRLLAENLGEPDLHAHQPEDPKLMPRDWAQAALVEVQAEHPMVRDADDLLRRLKMLAAMELAAEPGVRRWMRTCFSQFASVSTSPTPQGRDHTLTEPHAKYGRVKRLGSKPVDTFQGTDLFLRVVQAERDRLVTVQLGLDEEALQGALGEVARLYRNTDVSSWSKAWNEFRSEVVEDCIRVRLLPQLAAETRQRMLSAAKEVALDHYAYAFWRLAIASPLRLKLAGNEEGEEDAMLDTPRLMACCWGQGGTSPTVVVALDERGALVDLLPCGQLSGMVPRSGRSMQDNCLMDARKAKDAARLRDKILDKAPHALVVGVSNPAAAQLIIDFLAIRDHLHTDHARFMGELETAEIEVQAADERIAALWENCKAAKDEFPEQPAHVRRAIALGRLQLDPLPVLAQLCGQRREVLSLQLTDLQELLQPDERMQAVEQVLATVTAQVGLDINLAANVSWRRDLLQFAPGLGPRKAQALLQAIARNGNKVESRNFMYKDMGDVLGRIVFRNCGGCLRVSSAGLQHLANMELRVLDATRISPETYRLAVSLVGKATGEEDVEAAVEKHQEELEMVDLVSLAAERDALNKLSSLIDVQLELCAPAGELRPPYQALKEKDAFLLMHGETEASLCPGRLVEGKVVFVGNQELKVRLLGSSGLEGVIKRDNYSSNPSMLRNLRDCGVQRDQVVQARIIALQEEVSNRPGEEGRTRFMLNLSSQQQDLEPSKWEKELCSKFDKYFVVTSKEERDALVAAQRAELKEAELRSRSTPTHGTTPDRLTPGRTTPGREARAKSGDKICLRPIKHPLFQNITQKEAATQLLSRPVGACIVRPESGPSGLSLSVLVHASPQGAANVLHIKVSEAAERPGRHLQLSPPLKISMEHAGGAVLEFEDLDELHAAFVEPLVAQIHAVTSHRKFMEGSKTAVDERVRAEFTAANGNISPYYIGISSERSSVHFFISFCPVGSASGRARHDYFHPTPAGLYFRRRTFNHLERLLALFKQQPVSKDRVQEQGALGYTVPTSVPANIAAGQAPGAFGGARQHPAGAWPGAQHAPQQHSQYPPAPHFSHSQASQRPSAGPQWGSQPQAPSQYGSQHSSQPQGYTNGDRPSGGPSQPSSGYGSQPSQGAAHYGAPPAPSPARPAPGEVQPRSGRSSKWDQRGGGALPPGPDGVQPGGTGLPPPPPLQV